MRFAARSPVFTILLAAFLGITTLGMSGGGHASCQSMDQAANQTIDQAAGDQGDRLTWRLAVDSTRKLVFRQTTDSVTTVNKLTARVGIVMSAELTWHVDSVDSDGVMHITQKVDRLSMKLSPGGDQEEIEFDSQSAEAPRGPARDIAASARPLVGIETLFKMTPRGEILEARLSDASQKAVEPLAGRVRLAELFSAEGLTETLRQAMPRLPADPPQPGQTWSETTRAALATGKLAQANTYTFRGVSADQQELAEIDLVSQLSLEPAKEPAGPRVVLKDQRTEGKLRFDLQRGQFSKATISQTLVTESPYRDEVVRVRLESRLELEVR